MEGSKKNRIRSPKILQNAIPSKNLPFIRFEEGLVQKVFRENAARLACFPTINEIKNVVWSCEPLKAP